MGKKYNIGKDNPNYGKHPSIETLQKIRLTKLGEKNPIWRGDKVGHGGLHAWVRRRKPKLTLCEICGKESPFDLASVDHRYTRNLDDWQWLCRRCHMKIDGRLNDFLILSMENRKNLQRDERGRLKARDSLDLPKMRDMSGYI